MKKMEDQTTKESRVSGQRIKKISIGLINPMKDGLTKVSSITPQSNAMRKRKNIETSDSELFNKRMAEINYQYQQDLINQIEIRKILENKSKGAKGLRNSMNLSLSMLSHNKNGNQRVSANGRNYSASL